MPKVDRKKAIKNLFNDLSGIAGGSEIPIRNKIRIDQNVISKYILSQGERLGVFVSRHRRDSALVELLFKDLSINHLG